MAKQSTNPVYRDPNTGRFVPPITSRIQDQKPPAPPAPRSTEP